MRWPAHAPGIRESAKSSKIDIYIDWGSADAETLTHVSDTTFVSCLFVDAHFLMDPTTILGVIEKACRDLQVRLHTTYPSLSGDFMGR